MLCFEKGKSLDIQFESKFEKMIKKDKFFYQNANFLISDSAVFLYGYVAISPEINLHSSLHKIAYFEYRINYFHIV